MRTGLQVARAPQASNDDNDDSKHTGSEQARMQTDVVPTTPQGTSSSLLESMKLPDAQGLNMREQRPMKVPEGDFDGFGLGPWRYGGTIGTRFG